ERARFRTWLQRVARNRIIDWMRVLSRRCEACCDPSILQELQVSADEFDWEAEHRRQIVMHVLEMVRLECRSRTWACFELHFLQRLAVTEIARRTGLTISGVYINAYRTLKRVRHLCAQFDEDIEHGPQV
ncbi:MAG: hypothetical protein KDA75_21660, partial [Planctomycetaceae bacterium]|nr:hypothetical protein [Planctomycetaceae bacterium]